jgi:hypothetical protein
MSTALSLTSDRIKGYDVYVDDAFYSSDVADNVLDGKASFKLRGNRVYTITISLGRGSTMPSYRSEHTKNFKSGYSYQLKI